MNIAALLGLFAALIPLILHLLNRKRRDVIEFSSLMFLRELEKKEMNRLKMRRLLLLLIRTLAVISIVLAFSRPTLRGYLPGSSVSTAAVIVIDNSHSMRLKDRDDSLFDRTLTALSEIILTLNKQDKFAIIPTVIDLDVRDDRSVWLKKENNAVDRITVTNGSSYLMNSVEEGLKMLSTVEAANKEMFVLSDFQLSSGENGESAYDSMPPDVHYYLVEVKSDEVNYSVRKIDVVTKVLRNGGNASIDVILRSNSTERQDVRVDLFLQGKRVGQSTLSPVMGNDEKVSFVVPVSGHGFLEGFAEITEDALAADNRRYFYLYVPQQVNVLAIGSQTDLLFTLLALKSYSSASWNSNVKEITPLETDKVVMEDYDVILLTATSPNSEMLGKRLESFVRNGGGLLIFPGKDFDMETYNRLFAVRLGLPGIRGIIETGDDIDSYLPFDFIDWGHPLFAGIFLTNNDAVSSPKVKKYYALNDFKIGNDLISLKGNIPFLKEFRLGEGNIIMMLSAPLLDWNDFPLKGLWVPFVSRSVEYSMTGHSAFSDTVQVGNKLSFDLSLNEVEKNLDLVTPGGIKYDLLPAEKGGRLIAEFEETYAPGSYFLRADGEKIALKTVNVSEEEIAPEKDLDFYYRKFDTANVSRSSPSEIKSDIIESRLGVELWRYFAFLALLLLIAEMALQGKRRKVDKTSDARSALSVKP
ncbi:MAG: BatA domain-containing protein [Candidatus Marinimicrobia bacterium]|nr:BatA domain-containing protein [Candidatus Neomarinimicrobiota bacterium]